MIDSQTIARTILSQIGGGNLMACGARQYVATGDGIQMTVSKGQKLIVTLTSDDLYTVTVGRIRRSDYEWIVLDSREGVYADSIGEVVRKLGDRE